MWNVAINSIKGALKKALEALPDFSNLDYLGQGKVIDQTFKSLFKDLMSQFNMQPGIDYEDNLNSNEPCSDFVFLSEKANNLIKDLLDGKITVVKEHTRISSKGNQYIVRAHFKKTPQSRSKV